MRIERTDHNSIRLGPIDFVYSEFLRQIHTAAKPGDDPNVRQRFFPSPTNGKDPELDSDWQDYVQSGLEESFSSDIAIIQQDLKDFNPTAIDDPENCILDIPIVHLDAWIHGLNQARLAIATRYDFNEADMNAETLGEDHQRTVALFQEHFYGLLIECFIRVQERLEANSDEEDDDDEADSDDEGA